MKKRLAVALEHRFFRHDGAFYTRLSFPYDYWKAYLKFFGHVTVIARVQEVGRLDENMVRVDGPGVSFEPLPYYIGPRQFIATLPQLSLELFKVARRHHHFLLRSGNITNLLWLFLMMLRRPYLREYPGNVRSGVADFAGNSFRIRLLAGILHHLAKLQGRFAKANSFVSEYCRTLYQSSRPSFVFSSFNPLEIDAAKKEFNINGRPRLVSVGRLEREKGHAVLFEAVSKLAPEIPIIELIGDGGKRASLQKLGESLNLEVIFHGAVTDRNRLFDMLAASDLFVLPSLTEGMPRALLEAMAIGVPCIGTRVGGIPEVLQPANLCAANDSDALAELLRTFLADQSLRKISSRQHLQVIKREYDASALEETKVKFWSKLYA